MAKECSEIGTIKMGNHDGRVKQYPLSALAQEKIRVGLGSISLQSGLAHIAKDRACSRSTAL